MWGWYNIGLVVGLYVFVDLADVGVLRGLVARFGCVPSLRCLGFLD